MRSIDAPILIDILRRTLPEGVELNVHQHQDEHYEARYIPGGGIKLLLCTLLVFKNVVKSKLKKKSFIKALTK